MIRVEHLAVEGIHEDLRLTLGGASYLGDGYYLALDPGVEPGVEDRGKVGRQLRRLLDQWIEAVEQLELDAVLHLPFGYFDQCMSCVQVARQGEAVTLRVGWTEREGWSTLPSEIADFVHGVRDFSADADSPSVEGSVARLLDDLCASRDAL
ncbi:MAG: hypothetical protein O2816_11065 [Planctomycetota bacterium]|nr:hypothetical protein [Planctomycetota bacterium]